MRTFAFMKINEALLTWYDKEGRNLPWREEVTPYKIWLSEIIMQQTRIAQGLPYYNKFIKELPTIKAFAQADQDYILRLWQGLGYYSRARNMHLAAKQVCETFNGEFPNTFEELKKLKGVGDYTAAAIASIAFGKPKAVVDGNVYRVLSRLFNADTPIDTTTGKKYFQSLADELIDRNRPGDYNQAIMDFGAMVCTPRNPDCVQCPLKECCEGLARQTVDLLPVKSKKVKVTDRYFEFFEICVNDSLVIQQRSSNDIWKGLYQLPIVELDDKKKNGLSEIKSLLGAEELNIVRKDEKKHVLTHQILYAKFYRIELNQKIDFPGGYQWVKRDELDDYAFPKLISNYLTD